MNISKNRDRRISKLKIKYGCQHQYPNGKICGYRDNPRCLHFDHINQETKSDVVKNGYKNNPYNRDSSGGMCKLYRKKYPLKMLFDEIRKCRIICANHHGEKTFPDYMSRQ